MVASTFEKPLISVSYSKLVWNLALFNLLKEKLHIKYGFDKLIYKYEGHAKSFVTGFGLLLCYTLSNIFLLQTFKVFPPLLKHIFVTYLPSCEKQINSLLLVSVGDTDK